jgi:hypothetical protein
LRWPAVDRASCNNDSAVAVINRAYAMMQWRDIFSKRAASGHMALSFDLGVIPITVYDIVVQIRSLAEVSRRCHPLRTAQSLGKNRDPMRFLSRGEPGLRSGSALMDTRSTT